MEKVAWNESVGSSYIDTVARKVNELVEWVNEQKKLKGLTEEAEETYKILRAARKLEARELLKTIEEEIRKRLEKGDYW